MPRFFLPESAPSVLVDHLPEHLTLEGEDAFHLSVSLRARLGDEVTVCTADGIEILCRIDDIYGGKRAPVVILAPVSASKSCAESPVEITLFQGMPKGKKTDSILQKATELGVSRVVFVYSDHAVPVFTGEDKKNNRYQKIAEEAAKQCGRGKLVRVSVAENLDSVLDEFCRYDLAFACYEKEGERSLKNLLSRGNEKSIAFFIGPEGGISPREIALFEERGVPTVTLGKRILRTETASAAVLSMILYEKELLL